MILNTKLVSALMLIVCLNLTYAISKEKKSIYHYSKISTSWVNADRYCRVVFKNSRLLTIESLKENLYIYNKFLKGTKTDNGLWIGVRRLGKKKKKYYKRSDDCPMKFSNFQKKLSNDRCTLMTKMHKGKWIMAPCEKSVAKFICKRIILCDVSTTTPAMWTISKLQPTRRLKWYGATYYFVTLKMTKEDARDYCQSMFSAHLVFIDAHIENNWLVNQLAMDNDTDSVWTGGIYNNKMERWTWGHNCTFAYYNWGTRQPKEGKGTCIAMASNGEWRNADCVDTKQSICKKIEDVTKPCTLRKKWNKKEYYFSEISVNWKTANKYCKSLWRGTGDLLWNTEADKEDKFILKTTKHMPLWIGMNKINSKKWKWSKKGAHVTYTNWRNKTMKYKCGTIASDAKWDDTKCDLRHNFICKRSSTDYYVRREYLTWHEADDLCQNFWDGEGRLAFLTNKTEAAFIRSRIKNEIIWIGNRDKNGKGEWRRTDNCQVRYSRWDQGEPNGTYGDGNICAAMDTSTGLWYNDNCNKTRRRFVCKRVRFNQRCNFHKSEGEEYYIIGDARLNWNQANEQCKIMYGFHNGGLIHIRDIFENKWLKNHVKNRGLWIGLNYKISKSNWVWTDDGVLTFRQWNTSQPQGPYGHSCGIINQNGKWSNKNCLIYKTGFICKRIVYKRDWDLEFDSFYISTEQVTWDQAKEKCKKKYYSEIADIRTMEEYEWLKKQLPLRTANTFWLAGRNDGKSHWKWYNLNRKDKCPVSFGGKPLPWAREQPSAQLLRRPCLAIVINSNPPMSWYNLPCDHLAGYVCRRSLNEANRCDCQFNTEKGKQFKYFGSLTRTIKKLYCKNWHDPLVINFLGLGWFKKYEMTYRLEKNYCRFTPDEKYPWCPYYNKKGKIPVVRESCRMDLDVCPWSIDKKPKT